MSDGAFKYWVKRLLGSVAISVRPAKRPILIFSARRSGSTLLQQLIHSQPGIDFVSEPLNQWYYRPANYRALIPPSRQEQFVSLDGPEQAANLKLMFQRILSGKMKLQSQWRWLHDDYSFVRDRFVVKILHANALIDWFAVNFDAHIVFLVRHPVATAYSVMAREWSPTIDPYLYNESFRERHLDKKILPTLEQIGESGTELEKYVLEWGLVNLCPLKERAKYSWLTLTYEELVCRPHQMAELLAERLDLPDPGKLAKRLARPSKSANESSRALILADGPEAVIRETGKKLDTEARGAVVNVLGTLGIDTYTAASVWPNPEVCHFGPLGIVDPSPPNTGGKPKAA